VKDTVAPPHDHVLSFARLIRDNAISVCQ